MERYTGEENNIDIEFWERLRVLPEECETTKKAKEYIFPICSRLFKEKGGEYAKPDFFEKRFQFIVEDSLQIQASYTPENRTKDDRNILRVSKGLLYQVQNEAQLAFVLAHELGHFEVNETRGKDKFGDHVSSHEHEMQADYRGFKSLTEAGYNPDDAIGFFETINDVAPDIKSAYESANNEHGSTSTRIANIKDYKSAFERQGIVFTQDSGKDRLDKFKKEFIPVSLSDHYIGYFEERIRQEYNVASSYELSLDERWNFCDKIITQEPGVLSTSQRQGEFSRIFSENVQSLSKEEAAKANQILQKIYAYEKSSYNGYGEPQGEFTSACAHKLPPKDENGNHYIEPYGQVAQDIRYRRNIISNEKGIKEQLSWNADNVAKNLDDITHRKDDHFEYPEFSLEGLQVGDIVPWAEIAETASVTTKNGTERVLRSLGVDYDFFEHKYGNSLGYPIGKENDIYVDAKGVVISTDPVEVVKLRAESKEKVANLSIDERKRQMKLDFHDQLAVMAQNEHGGTEYNRAKQKAAEIYKESGTAFITLDNTQDLLLNDKFSFKVSQADNSHPSVRVFEEEVKDNPSQYFVQQGANPKYAAQFYPQYVEVVLETELENIRDVYHSERYPKVKKAMSFVNDFQNNLLDKDNKMDSVSHEVLQKMAPSIFKAYGDEMGDAPGEEAVGYFNRIITQTLLNDHVGADGNLPYVEDFRQRQQIKDAQNTDELVANIEKMKPDENQIIYAASTVGYSKLLYDYEVMRTINAGIEIDVNRTLNALPGAVSPDLADKMTDYVIQKDLFAAREGESVEQTYERCKELYITMSAKEAFTSKDHSQRDIENKLLEHMQKLSPERQVQEAYDLLDTHTNHALAGQKIENEPLLSLGQTDREKAEIMAERLKELGGSVLQYDKNKQLVEHIYADHIIQKYGIDDNSDSYRENINNELSMMSADIAPKSRKRICETVAKGIMAQKDLAYDIKEIHDKGVSNNQAKGQAARGYNLLDTYLTRNPEFAQKTMVFLLSNGNAEDCKKFSADLAREYNTHRYLIPNEWKENLDNKLKDKNIPGFSSKDLVQLAMPEDSFVSAAGQLHEEYLNAGFEERAVIMHRLLDSYANGANMSDEEKLQKQISFVSDKIFGTREQDKELLTEVKAVSTAVCHQEDQPSLLLGAVLSGREPGQADENMNVGDGLAMFCEKQGTAWVKLAQTLSYVDALPDDIRSSLGRLKDKANEPKQWEVHQDLEEAMPESELRRIKRVQKFIGGGTFNKTILVDVENLQTNSVETKVVQVMHDRAATKSEREFKKINAAIDELCGQDPKYEILKSVAERSAKNAVIEVDIKEGANQYKNACENYGRIENVELNDVTYIPKVATWERYGESLYSNYKIMEMAPGKSIDSPDFTPEQRHDMALAYTMIELSNLMGGKAWDIDRHSKQQNFNVTKDENGKTVVEIGIFDTGAQRPAPTKEEKKLLGKFLVAVVKEQQQNKDSNLGEFMLDKIKKFEKAGKDVNYVSDVQRGLLAISDVMQHMNTPERPNGMAEGLITCFKELKNKGLIDDGLYKSLIRETGKSLLKSPSLAKKAINMALHPTEEKDKLTLNLSKDDTKIQQQIRASVQADKPAHETEKIELEKTRIRPKPKSPAEQVHGELEKLGIPKESYLLLTPDDTWMRTEYGSDESRSIDLYFNRQEEAKKNNAKILMGCNNGTTALYFAEQNIYVVSPGYKLRDAMFYRADCKDVGYGVMFSNGEKFTNASEKWAQWTEAQKFVKASEEKESIQKRENIKTSEQPQQKNSELAQSILKLRGVNTTNKSSVSEADASHVIDFTETKEFEEAKETRAANNEANSPNKAKVSKRVKRIINIARGIIQPRKKQPATDKGRVSENDITRAAVTKEMANGGR